jgi:predicted GNAT family N-acyltransferase
MSVVAGVDIRRPRDAAERAAAVDLRIRVFCGEQGVTPDEEFDGRDDDAIHLVAVADGAVVGTCRLLFEGATGKFGRLAVEPRARRRGIGASLLAAAEREARAAGAGRIALNAQAHARSLYAAAGYAERGEPFQEAGIEHVRMERLLA